MSESKFSPEKLSKKDWELIRSGIRLVVGTIDPSDADQVNAYSRVLNDIDEVIRLGLFQRSTGILGRFFSPTHRRLQKAIKEQTAEQARQQAALQSQQEQEERRRQREEQVRKETLKGFSVVSDSYWRAFNPLINFNSAFTEDGLPRIQPLTPAGRIQGESGNSFPNDSFFSVEEITEEGSRFNLLTWISAEYQNPLSVPTTHITIWGRKKEGESNSLYSLQSWYLPTVNESDVPTSYLGVENAITHRQQLLRIRLLKKTLKNNNITYETMEVTPVKAIEGE